MTFDMAIFGTSTTKPTMLLTNSRAVCKLNGRRVKRGRGRKGRSLCKRYVDSNGRTAYCGTKWLKKSQNLG